MSKTPTAANIEFHSRIVQEKYLKRSLLQVSGQILENRYDETVDALDEIDRAEQEIFKIAEKRFMRSYSDEQISTSGFGYDPPIARAR